MIWFVSSTVKSSCNTTNTTDSGEGGNATDSGVGGDATDSGEGGDTTDSGGGLPYSNLRRGRLGRDHNFEYL